MKPASIHRATVTAVALVLAAGTVWAQEGGRPLSANLTGAAEVPGPGDPDGKGSATLRVNPGQEQVCYELSVSGIEPATMAHIHKGGPTVDGGVVVTLTAPTSGSSSGCAAAARSLAQDIIQNPGGYYVNVHNGPFPTGAVRGQLMK